jgi:hypothetical protein
MLSPLPPALAGNLTVARYPARDRIASARQHEKEVNSAAVVGLFSKNTGPSRAVLLSSRVQHGVAVVGSCLPIVFLCVPGAAIAAPPQGNPNIILIISDDHGWSYYGFMQRYLPERLERGELQIDPNPPSP